MKTFTIILTILAFSILYGDTITSTAAGSNWTNTGTWIGEQVPAEGDDVIIFGPVNYNTSNRIVGYLTNEAAGSLKVYLPVFISCT